MTTQPYETKTKIVATLGPASWDEPVLSDLIRAGTDVFRINCSHADHDSIRQQASRVRHAAKQLGQPVAVLLDLQGPKVRTGPADTPIILASGDLLTVIMDSEFMATGKRVGTTYPEMAQDVNAGAAVLFADGALAGTVEAIRLDISPAEVDIRISVGGKLGSRKGINLPGLELTIPAITEKDLADLAVGMEIRADFVAMSFVQRPEDVVALREAMKKHGHVTPIIAKIEKPTAVERIDEICEVAEGVMVARGDLGVEVSLEKVPVYQKRIIQAAFDKHRIIITATQMLDSMERNPRPTRAETTDIANAILDGTDAVMLSGETSIGSYPVEAVQVMDQIAREIESSQFFKPTQPTDASMSDKSETHTVLRAAGFTARALDVPLVIFNWTGRSALYLSKIRNRTPIYALTDNTNVQNLLQLVWGVTPLQVPTAKTLDALIKVAEDALLATGQVKRGDTVTLVTGHALIARANNLFKLHVIGKEDQQSARSSEV